MIANNGPSRVQMDAANRLRSGIAVIEERSSGYNEAQVRQDRCPEQPQDFSQKPCRVVDLKAETDPDRSTHRSSIGVVREYCVQFDHYQVGCSE